MGDFQKDEVLFFIISKGGRVRNHELVTHFKNFLDHPNNKAQNRVLFKDYVNDLASVKVEEGQKVLVLKKKYRPPGPGDSFRGSTSSMSSTASSLSASSASQMSLYKSSAMDSGMVTPQKSVREEREEVRVGTSEERTPVPSPARVEESPRAKSEPPNMTSTPNEERSLATENRSNNCKEQPCDATVRRPDPPATSARLEDSPSITSSNMSLVSNESLQSADSSTSGVASMEEEGNASVISVKDKIKHLNRIESETTIGTPKGTGVGMGNKKSSKHGSLRVRHTSGDDDDSHSSGVSYISLDDEQREWMVICAGTEYHEMNRLLSKNPNLAPFKDLTNGYTALHWAAKSGKDDVIKLIANKPGVNINQRSHGGYSPLHLAAIHGHEHIIELLVNVFKADANLRDYSGRKAKQYLKNSASSKAQQLLMSRRVASDQAMVRLGGNDDQFSRSASFRMSNRAKAMSSLMGRGKASRSQMLRSTWAGSHEDVGDDRDGRTPPGSNHNSPASARRRHTATYKDVNLMPPPPNAMMGGRKQRNIDRSRSSSRESLNSRSSNQYYKDKNDENYITLGGDSDNSLKEGTIV